MLTRIEHVPITWQACICPHDVQGVQGSRRGDMEVLGYALLQWLGDLPWRVHSSIF